MAKEHDDKAGADELLPVPVSSESEEAALTAPSGQALQDCERVLASFAPSTRATYRRAVERFAVWTRGRGVLSWKQINDRLLADYVAHLRDGRGLGHASATVEVSAIRTVARAMGCPVLDGPLSSAALTTMRKSADLQKRRRGQAVPIRWAKADAAACLAEAEGSVIGLRDAAIFALMSDAMLRISELVGLDSEHVTGQEDGSGRVFVARSKTDQGGRGASLYLGPSTLERVRAWQAAAGIADGPLFRRMRRGGHVQDGRMTTRGLNMVIRKRAKAVGIEGASGHSFRVGSAQSLAEAGASVVDLQHAGRWKDPRMPEPLLRGTARGAGRGGQAPIPGGSQAVRLASLTRPRSSLEECRGRVRPQPC